MRYINLTLVGLCLIGYASISYAGKAKEEVVAPEAPEAESKQSKIILAADYYCPYTCKAGSAREGMLTELAKRIFDKHGIEVEYKTMPWNQALRDLQNGVIDGVMGAKIDEIKARFPSVHQTSSQTASFVTYDSKWFYDGVSSLSENVIGLVDGYSYPLELKSYIYSLYIVKPELFSFASGEDPVGDNIKKLEKKQIFTYIEDENVIRDYMKSNNIVNIKNVGYISPLPTKIYIAFSYANPNSSKYAKIMTEETLIMKTNLELQTLYDKYNIKEY